MNLKNSMFSLKYIFLVCFALLWECATYLTILVALQTRKLSRGFNFQNRHAMLILEHRSQLLEESREEEND